MKSSTRALVLGIAGVIALTAGYFAGRRSGGDAPGASTEVGVSKLERPQPQHEGNAVGVNSELLVGLRKLGRQAGSYDRLRAEDFPDALLRVHGYDDYEVGSALLRRWFEVDREGLVDFFLAQGSITLRSGPLSSLSIADLVLGLLVADDPLTAWETALKFPRDRGYRRSVLGVIARESPELAVKLALQNLDKLTGGGAYFHLGKEANRKFALALAQRLPFGVAEAAALKQVYFANDLKAQLEIWNSLDEETQERTAAAFMPQHDDGGASAEQFYQMLTERIESGTEQDATVVRRFLEVFSKRLVGTQGIADAVGWVEQHLVSNGKMNALNRIFDEANKAGVPRGEILAQFGSLPVALRQGLAGSVINSIFSKDLTAAADWVAGLPPDQSAVSGASALGHLLAKRSDEQIRAALLKLPVGSHSDTFLLSVAGGQLKRLGFEKSIEWVESLPDDRSQAAMGTIMRNWSYQQPAAAAEYLSAMPQEAPHREVLVRAIAERRELQSWSEDRGNLLG